MKPSRGLTPARRPAATPSRNTRPQATTDSTTSSTSSNNDDNAAAANNASSDIEEVAVFCRIRPSNDNEEVCIQAIDNKTLQLSPPESSRAFYSWGFNEKEVQYSFREVFDVESTQKQVFDKLCLPLVRDLLSEKNGLLFTYGVTGSGKTYTMQGTPKEGGLLPRTIDVIFNSLDECQVNRKHLIVPDKLNGFQVQEVTDAILADQAEQMRHRQAPRRGGIINNVSDPNLSGRLPDETRVDVIDHNRIYAVFVSYVEIYNNYIYDLLEADARDVVTGKTKFTTRGLREDSYGNVYIGGINEVQVMSPKEALETFYRGQKRRRVAETQLNHESSRSHSVFTIRIVKAFPSGHGEVDLNKSCTISQLSLVDLAGSERTSRTGNTGSRLREAGNINNSLMTLRACIEKLRENTKAGKSGGVPYRNSKVTHLFRNYFDGQGAIRMLVCVNPRGSDCDENINVLQFAELTQQVQIERRPDANAPRDFGLTPGQKRANEIYKEALKRAHDQLPSTPAISLPIAPIYSLGPDWPSLEMMECDDDETLEVLERYLEKRICTRQTLIADHKGQLDSFRSGLVDKEQSLILLREENAALKSEREADQKRIKDLEARLVNAENANDSLQRRVKASQQAKTVLENELDEKELLLNQQKKDVQLRTRKLKAHLTQQEIANNELAMKLRQQEMEKAAQKKDEAKLEAVRAILNADDPRRLKMARLDPEISSLESDDVENIISPSNRKSLAATKSDTDMRRSRPSRSSRRSSAVANARYRRSQSTGDQWIDHHSPNEVPLNTILKPNIKGSKRSVTKLTEQDIFNQKTSKYCLTSQEQDTDGEVETKLFKGDVIPTAGGGRAVIFNDVEVLRQKSPERLASPSRRRSRSPAKKRSYEEFRGVGSRIAALEGRLQDNDNVTSKKYRV